MFASVVKPYGNCLTYQKFFLRPPCLLFIEMLYPLQKQGVILIHILVAIHYYDFNVIERLTDGYNYIYKANNFISRIYLNAKAISRYPATLI